MTPSAFDRVVKTCLEKDPEDRWQTAHDVMLQLKWIAEGGSQAGLPAPAPGRRRNKERIAWITTGLLLLGLLAAIPFAIRGLRGGVEEPRVVKLSILPPEKTIILPGHFAVSPDGRSIAFVALAPDGRSLLWVRPFRSLDAEPLPGTELAAFPFWSPDSRFIGFFADQKLKKVEASGGPPQVLCDAPNGRGGAWNRDDVILFAPTPTSPLYRVSAGGGEPSQATSLDAVRQENSHRYPSFLTDGRHFLFYARSHRPENRAISLGSIDSREVRRLVGAGSNMAFVRPGFLLFVREGGALVARRFDERALKLAGDPVLVAENVRPADAIAAASFSVSEGGVLAYGSGASNAGQLVWMDRAGRQLGSIDHPGFLVDFRLSPDEKRVAMDLVDSEIGGRQIWLQEPARGVVTRFTFGALQDVTPIWSPDGSRIAFASNRGGPAGLHQIYQKHSSGAGTEEVILRENTQKFVTDWSRDGKFILFDATSPKSSTRSDLWALALQGDRTPRPFVRTAFNETHGRFSPDGRWVAYVSDETGRPEVYVQSFPLSTGKWRISSEGGHQPTWRRDGKELFYFSRSRILHAVTVTSGSSGLEAGPPRPLFPLPRTQAHTGRSSYDVSADGQRFLVSADRERQASQPLHVVLNWMAELKP